MNHDKKGLKALPGKREQLSKNKQLWPGGGRTWSMGLCALALSACTSMAPPLPPVQADIPPAWPLASTTLTTAAQATAPAPEPTAGMVDNLDWRSVFSIRPQSGSGGFTPRPRKERPEPSRMPTLIMPEA